MMGAATSFAVAPINAGSIGRTLKVFPIGGLVLSILILLACLALGLILCLALGLIPTSGTPWPAIAVLIAVPLILPLPIMVLAVIWLRSAHVDVSETRLRAVSSPFGPSVLLGTLRSREARIVDLVRERSFTPTGLMFGANIPGCYTAGSGSLRTGERARWLLTDVSRVVYIPGDGGPSVLLSVRSPEEFVATLHAQATPSAA